MHNDGKTTQIDPESTPTLDNGLPPLIPKKILFGNPDKASPRLSPDCKFLAYLAPSPEGVLNVFIRNLSTGEENQLTQDKDSGIVVYRFHQTMKNLDIV